jgi:hypothetical protein
MLTHKVASYFQSLHAYPCHSVKDIYFARKWCFISFSWMCIFTSTPYLEFLENQSEFLIIKILYIHFYLFYMSETIFILSWSLFLLFNPNVSLLYEPRFLFKAFCWWFFIRFPISSCVNIIDFISLMGHPGHALYLSR